VEPLPLGVRAASAVAGPDHIYVVGGTAAAGKTGLLQIFDVSSGRWSIGASLPNPTDWGTLVRVGTHLHFLGGVTDQVAASQQHWIYDPDADAWTAGTPLPIPAAGAAGAAVASHLFVLGGIEGPGRPADNVLVFDLESERWSVGRPMPAKRYNWAGALVNGRILVAGGATGQGQQNTDELVDYDHEQDLWTILERIPRSRDAHGAAAFGPWLCLAGGRQLAGRDSVRYPDAACYHSELGTWTVLPDLPEPRHEHAMAAVKDDLYAIGGRDSESRGMTEVLRLRLR
jgi:hypothetical protein